MSGQDVERDVALVREALEHGGAQFNVPQALAALDRLTAKVYPLPAEVCPPGWVGTVAEYVAHLEAQADDLLGQFTNAVIHEGRAEDRVRELEADVAGLCKREEAALTRARAAEARVRELEADLEATAAISYGHAQRAKKLWEALKLAEHELVMGGGTTKPILKASHIIRAALAEGR